MEAKTTQNESLSCELIQLKNIIARIEQQDGSLSVNRLIPKKVAAAKLGVSQRTIERWCVGGYIGRIQVGGRIYFHQSEIDRIIDYDATDKGLKVIGSQPLLVADIVKKYGK